MGHMTVKYDQAQWIRGPVIRPRGIMKLCYQGTVMIKQRNIAVKIGN